MLVRREGAVLAILDRTAIRDSGTRGIYGLAYSDFAPPED
jgi:hypothetical protein